MSGLNVVILAAGKGTRMHSALPKVLHPLAGEPLLRHVIERAKSLRPESICVIYGHGGEAVPAAFAGEQLTFVLQEPQLGTGHALMEAIPHLPKDGQTLVLYGDVPLTEMETLSAVCAKKTDLTLLTALLENPHGYGRIVRDQAGKIQRIVEEKDASPDERKIREVNTGILLCRTEKLICWLGLLENDNAQGEYYLTDIVASAVNEGAEVSSAHPRHEWEILGVNSKNQLAALERIKQKNSALELMHKGVTLLDPARIDVRGKLECGRDVVIDVNCVFLGEVSLGEGVEIGANCILQDATVGPGSKIEAFSHVVGARIAGDCRIGPYARIRPGTLIEDRAHIGNFVEVKASRIGEGSKANHLSYLGDSDVGRQVNIGAGTITCNYDGANKHKTVIEDEAFIGSDSQLIAPVKIGKGNTVGAGSTITRDTPAGGLTVARATKQIHIEGWKRPQKKG